MDDAGLPIAYLVLREGTPVFDRRGERIGVVKHVLADEDLDIFHGLIIQTLPLFGRHLFADADQIAELRERGVLLSVPGTELHQPRRDGRGERPGRQEQTGPEQTENTLQARLRRAWDWIDKHV